MLALARGIDELDEGMGRRRVVGARESVKVQYIEIGMKG